MCIATVKSRLLAYLGYAEMATTTTWITTAPISHRHDVDLLNDNNSLPAFPERTNIKEIHSETTQVESPSSDQTSTYVSLTNKLAPTQNALLLHAIKEKYTLVTDHAVPSILHQDEILIEVFAIGLNPIDWKAPYVFPFVRKQPYTFVGRYARKVKLTIQ